MISVISWQRQLWHTKWSHLNSRIFNLFSRLSRLKANDLLFLISKVLTWALSSVSLCIQLVAQNFFIVSSMTIFSSIEANLCFIWTCSKTKKAKHEKTKTTTATQNMNRTNFEKLSSPLSCFLSWSVVFARRRKEMRPEKLTKNLVLQTCSVNKLWTLFHLNLSGDNPVYRDHHWHRKMNFNQSS